MDKRYTYSVEWSVEDTEWYGLCAQYPGLSWFDDTKEKALSGIKLLVAEALGDLDTCNCCGKSELDTAMHDKDWCTPCKYSRCNTCG
jgi:hypothetical protein